VIRDALALALWHSCIYVAAERSRALLVFGSWRRVWFAVNAHVLPVCTLSMLSYNNAASSAPPCFFADSRSGVASDLLIIFSLADFDAPQETAVAIPTRFSFAASCSLLKGGTILPAGQHVGQSQLLSIG
jgi:hypothetical protein